MEPDRFAEERRRGMTIDLGYAWTTVPPGLEVAFVDVPGHQRFIANMLAGLGPALNIEEPRFEKSPFEDILEMTFPVDPRLKTKVRTR